MNRLPVSEQQRVSEQQPVSVQQPAHLPHGPGYVDEEGCPSGGVLGGITTEDFIGRLKQTQGRVEAGGVLLTGLTGTTDQWGTTPECSGVQARPMAYQH
ncbi:unnamed protein product [Boreogadus saida]